MFRDIQDGIPVPSWSKFYRVGTCTHLCVFMHRKSLELPPLVQSYSADLHPLFQSNCFRSHIFSVSETENHQTPSPAPAATRCSTHSVNCSWRTFLGIAYTRKAFFSPSPHRVSQHWCSCRRETCVKPSLFCRALPGSVQTRRSPIRLSLRLQGWVARLDHWIAAQRKETDIFIKSDAVLLFSHFSVLQVVPSKMIDSLLQICLKGTFEKLEVAVRVRCSRSFFFFLQNVTRESQVPGYLLLIYLLPV